MQSRVAILRSSLPETHENETQGKNLSLWERILGLLEEDLARRHERRIFVRVPDGDGSYEEFGEPSSERLRGLDSGLHGWVAEQLLDRYLAEGGYVDLLGKRHAYTKRIDDLVPEDLADLVRADRMKVEVYLQHFSKGALRVTALRELLTVGLAS